jgi:hypothetical protein
MKPWIWLRVAAVLQALGTVGHTLASLNSPSRGSEEEAVFNAMRAFHFDVMGSNRSHWDFYKGYELSISVSFLLLAVLIWQLSNMSRTAPRKALPLIVTILIAEILLGVLGWMYFFAAPGVVSILIALCLVMAMFTIYRADERAVATAGK